MFYQEAEEQQLSETLTAEEIIQPVLVELSEEELLEVVTGAGGGFSRPQPEGQGPFKGVLVRTLSGNLMKSEHGNLIVAIPHALTDPPLPVHPSAESPSSGHGHATNHGNSSPSSEAVDRIFMHVL